MFLGVSSREFTKLVDAGLVTPVYLIPKTRAFYSRAQLASLSRQTIQTARKRIPSIVNRNS